MRTILLGSPFFMFRQIHIDFDRQTDSNSRKMPLLERWWSEVKSYRKIDKQNRIVIPRKMVQLLGVDPEDFLKITVENGTIILRPIVEVDKKEA